MLNFASASQSIYAIMPWGLSLPVSTILFVSHHLYILGLFEGLALPTELCATVDTHHCDVVAVQ